MLTTLIFPDDIYPCSRYTPGHNSWLNGKYGSWNKLMRVAESNDGCIETEIIAAVQVWKTIYAREIHLSKFLFRLHSDCPNAQQRDSGQDESDQELEGRCLGDCSILSFETTFGAQFYTIGARR
jgi:hypothetical protein